MKLERRRGSTLDTADTVLAVVVGVLAVMAVLWVLSWVFSTIFFLIKLAVLGLIIAGVVALVSKVRGSSY
jgi:hypothetical protein